MKLFNAAALVAVSLLASGCSGCTTPAVLSNSHGVLEGQTADEKSLIVLEAAFFGANSAAEAAIDNHLLVAGSPKAVQLADYLKTARAALIVARTAYAAGDAQTYSAKFAAVQGLVSAAWKLIPTTAEH